MSGVLPAGPQLRVPTPQVAYDAWVKDETPPPWCDRLSRVEEDGKQVHWESIDDWRHLARRANAILECNQLALDKVMPSADLLRLALAYPENLPLPQSSQVRFWLGAAINRWLELGGDAPNLLQWTRRGEPRRIAATAGLFVTIGLQLADTFDGSRTRNPFTGAQRVRCSECGEYYRPKRQPAAGRRRYCDKCGQRAASRHSKREQRRKAREGK